MEDINELKKSVLSGDRVGLGKAITLVESNHPDDRKIAGKLLNSILGHTGNSLRVGITGVPGVGKSTFIEAIGSKITSEGKKLAVLAIDPSSPHSRGSILGDKTRMNALATNPNAFIRPSSSGGQLGGVANKTMEAILLCEAAGYDVILIETVGVGQSEVAVKNMTDIFLLLMLAGAGDELQGIKRGIMEMADLLVINKADGDNQKPAELAKNIYENALHLFAPKDSKWITPVMTCSSLNQNGIDSIWEKLEEFEKNEKEHNRFGENRINQKKLWLNDILNIEVINRLKRQPETSSALLRLEKDVIESKTTPYQASEEILNIIFKAK